MKNKIATYLILVSICMSCNNGKISKNEKNDLLPNIILIMADDLGYNDLGCYGSENIKTPNIDKLASDGVRFTDYHSNGVVCSPTRAALITGKYQQRTGIEGVVTAKNHRHTGFSGQVTIADYLRTLKYSTGIIGKWHLGYDTLFSPLNNGFDYFRGYVSGNIDYHSHIDQEGYYDWWLDKDTITEEGYSTDLITYNSLNFISDNLNNPFFLYVAHEAPHYPFQGRKDPADRTVNGEFDVQGSRKDRLNAYKEMIEVMDEGIGRIINYLDKNSLLENTLIFFCSDNGAAKPGSNAPLNGYKGNVWEGGHRVPAIVYWKNEIPPKEIDQTIMSMDIFPTILDLLGNSDQLEFDFDGQSFLSLLKGTGTVMQNRELYWRFGTNKKAVRLNNWKYIKYKQEEYLFNLAEDLKEENNLIELYPNVVDSLNNFLIEWENEMSKYKLLTN